MSWIRSCCAILCFAAISMILGGCGNSVPPIAVSLSPSARTIDQGQTTTIAAQAMNDLTFAGVTWTLTGPGSLSNTSGSSTTYAPPTTALSSALQITITATSIKDTSKSASVQITVNPYLTIPLQDLANGPFYSLANGTVGVPYSEQIALTGGTPPYQWIVYSGPISTGWKVGGGVPDGLTLDPSSGTISGTPTGGGTWYFEVWVTDAVGVSTFDGSMSLQINPTALSGNPVPFLNQPVPASVSPGSPSLTLPVSGAGFVSGATVDWNGVPLTTTFTDHDHLTAVVPAASLAAAVTATIIVVNPAPGGGPSNTTYLQVGTPEAAVTFVNAPNTPLQVPLPFVLAVADFNGDGKPDLAVAGNVRMYVFLGSGNGALTPAPGSPNPVPSPPYDDFPSPYVGPALAIGDFNRSGHPGLAVGLMQNIAAAILFGNGDGTFTDSSTLANTAGEYTSSLTAADFNADGNLDLVAVNPYGPSVTLLGYSHGAFNAVPYNLSNPDSGASAVAGDFNGDGKLDLFVGATGLLLGNGDGTFTQGFPLSTLSTTDSTYVAAGDFNGDGNLDVAICDWLHNTVTILLGDGKGNFNVAPGSPMSVGNQPDAMVVGDFNNDGKLDVAIANNADGTVTLLLGNGDGTFTEAPASPYAVGNSPLAIAAADLNGDGKLDLIVANTGDGTVSVLLQK